ncbi:MAG: methyltransferase domain-containing protein, partial [Candidatus Staskawiczbacteria bacterium]|nr:methyltransferase domain-containing protein [Candidatus Staskawiczbacteria bacterium]
MILDIVIVILFISLFIAFLLFFISMFFDSVIPFMFWGAFYAETEDKKIEKMIEFANIKPGEKAVDLGAGDGRIVIALAKKGIEAHGYEINPILVAKAKDKIEKAGLKGKAFMHWGNFWKKDISGFDIIIIFGISFIMKKLGKKLKKEAKDGSKIISNYF